jgi:serine/threonine protein kinase/Flp pilus assembly protein TadD
MTVDSKSVTAQTGSSVADRRVAQALELYLARLESGSPPDKDDFLRQYPDIADRLRSCLESLQLVEGAAGTLAEDLTLAVDSAPLLGTLGDFRILRQIGRGGMGVVYEAEQISLGRRVALKVLPFAAVMDQRQLQRFKNEAQAAAALDHPHIVHVHAVGCERGVHYYAMQYIEGQTLAEVIDALRRLEPDVARLSEVSSKVVVTLRRDEPPREDFPHEESPRDELPRDEPPRDARQLNDIERHESAAPALRPDNALPSFPSKRRSPQSPAPSEPAAATRNRAAAFDETLPVAALSTQRSSRRPEYFQSVARLCIQACEALDHAHQMGVVHRDIKPLNLLIDHQGKLFVTDFGLALVEGNHNLTMSGDVVGTLRYMSPEQAAGHSGVVDHRSDIYSLGITLYELLTLRPAFDQSDRQRLLRQVMETDPIPPRHHTPSIPRDLETIVLKAIAKEPAGRFESAGQLAADLQAFLDDRPIQTKRARRTEHAWRWAKRNRAMASLIAAVWILLCVLAIAGPFMAWKQATLAAHEAAARKSAEDHRGRLQQILDRTLVGRGDALADVLPMEQLQHQIADEALRYYRELFEQRREDPEIRFQAGVAYQRLARINRFSDQPSKTAEMSARAIAILTPLVNEFPTNERVQHELSQALRIHGAHLTLDLKDPQTAIGYLEQAVFLAERLVQADPDSRPYYWQLKGSRGFLAGASFDCGRLAEAELHWQANLRAGLMFLQRNGADENTVYSLASAASELGAFYLESGRFAEAERELEEAQELFARCSNDFVRKHPDIMARLGEHFVASGNLNCGILRPDSAERFFRDAIAMSEELVQRFKPFRWGQTIRAKAYEGLSNALLAMDRIQDAEQAMRASLREWQQLDNIDDAVRDVHADLAWSQIRMGQLLWWTGRHTAAGELFGMVRNRLEELLSADPSIRAYQLPLAVLLTTCPDDRLRDAERSIELAEVALHREDGSSWQLLGVAYYRAGKLQRAIDALDRSVGIWNGGDAFNWAVLAMAHAQLGNEQKARQSFDKFVNAVKHKRPVQLTNFTHPLCLHDLRQEAETLFHANVNDTAPP